MVRFSKTSLGNIFNFNDKQCHFYTVKQIDHGLAFKVDLVESFEAIGRSQRTGYDSPQDLARQIARCFGGGVICNITDKVGCILHRLTHHVTFGTVNNEEVKEKVDVGLRRLESLSLFEQEHHENLRNNAYIQGISVEDLSGKLSELLIKYADSFKKIPVYNHIQWYAREAAISLGEQDFEKAKSCLKVLDSELSSKKDFVTLATAVMRDDDEKIIEFTGSDRELGIALSHHLKVNKLNTGKNSL